jgi:hypothetical protein
MAGLINRELVSESALPSSSNNMASKFHLVVKYSEKSQTVYKARLFIFRHMDAEKGQILSEAPTVSQMTIITLISISYVNEWPILSRDIRLDFLQSESLLSLAVYMRSPRQLQASSKLQRMRLKKSLYGIME